MPRRLVKAGTSQKTKTMAARAGDSRTIHSLGRVNVTICVGDKSVAQHYEVQETNAFDIVVPTDFFRRNPFSVSLQPSRRKDSGLRYPRRTAYRTGNYQVARPIQQNGLVSLQLGLKDIQVEQCASKQ